MTEREAAKSFDDKLTWLLEVIVHDASQPTSTRATLNRIADYAQNALSMIADLKRRLGGGCEARQGGDHIVVKDSTGYAFCADCGEGLRGVRYCHLPRGDHLRKESSSD